VSATHATSDDTALDNPVWWALNGPQRAFGTVSDGAALFHRDVAPFGAFEGEPTAAKWDAMASLVGPGGRLTVMGAGTAPPAGWIVEHAGPGVQMVCEGLAARAADLPAGCSVAILGPDDLAEVATLIDAARPGPFGDRTLELGRYVGIREGGRLVAMAGERLRLPGYTEVSAVATLPSHRRRGLAAAVVHCVAATIVDAGTAPFLSAAAANGPAIALYASLGFRLRGPLDFRWLRRDEAAR